MKDETDAAARDLDAVEVLRAMSVDGVSPTDDAVPVPLDRETLHRAVKRVARRIRGASKPKECSVLAIAHSALLRSLMNMSSHTGTPTGLVDAQGKPIQPAEPEYGDGDPPGLRATLFVILRQYHRAVPAKTWDALVFAYNCTQAGREQWRIRDGGDLTRITFDQSPDGTRLKPGPSGGFNLPAAHIYRMMGYDDEQ